MESAHPIGMQATEYGWSPWQDGLVRGAEHTSREHRQRQVEGSGLNMRSGRVIVTYRSSFGEEYLSGSKSLDKIHGALAARARPCGWLRGGGCICCRRRLVEQAAAERKQPSTGAVGQPAEVGDAGEASGQDVLYEAAQELLRRERHGALLAAMRVVLPAEGDSGVGDGEQAMVGDGDTMGVTREIVQHMLGSAEGRLGIDDPVLLEQGAQEGGEGLFVVERRALAAERELAVAKSASQSSDELAAEDTAEHLDGQEEVRARRYPVALIRRQTAAGHDTVDMRVRLQGLSPSMQDGE